MILEIRTYRVRPGAVEEFVRIMREDAVPLLETFGVRVVDYGASLAAEDGLRDAFLIRAFGSLDERREQRGAVLRERRVAQWPSRSDHDED